MVRDLVQRLVQEPGQDHRPMQQVHPHPPALPPTHIAFANYILPLYSYINPPSYPHTNPPPFYYCPSPLHKESKLDMARRVVSGSLFNESWVQLDQEVKALEKRRGFGQLTAE